jgi:hypothetical protein
VGSDPLSETAFVIASSLRGRQTIIMYCSTICKLIEEVLELIPTCLCIVNSNRTSHFVPNIMSWGRYHLIVFKRSDHPPFCCYLPPLSPAAVPHLRGNTECRCRQSPDFPSEEHDAITIESLSRRQSDLCRFTSNAARGILEQSSFQQRSSFIKTQLASYFRLE